MTLDLFYFKNNQYISYNIVNCAIFEESYEHVTNAEQQSIHYESIVLIFILPE